MGFFSSAVFYRPATPPAVTAKGLAIFLEQLRQTDIAKDSKLSSVQINWSDRISEKVRPFDLEASETDTTHKQPWWKRLFIPHRESTVTTSISTIKSLDPDFSHDSDFNSLIERLRNTDQTIGRLYLSGSLTDEQYEWFQEPHPSGEEINFSPDSWSLTFGEVNLSRLNGWDLDNGETISEVQIGMMSFSLDGYGYFYPWTFKEWVEKFTLAPGLQEVCDLCRQTWRIESVPPSDELVMLRRECEELWPYDNIHAPLDWAWGPEES
ncbi:MAG: hypothetical protein AAF711_09375 [Planctomycetota bacterium]